MLVAKRTINLSVDPMPISQALRHQYADQFMAAFADEISSLKDMKTFVTYIGDPKDIPKDLSCPLKQYLLWFIIQMILSKNSKLV